MLNSVARRSIEVKSHFAFRAFAAAESAAGPIIVMFENLGLVLGCAAYGEEPSLSDSNPLEDPDAEASKMVGSLFSRTNCSFPEKPKSVSKQSSSDLQPIRYLACTFPPKNSKSSSL